MKRALLIAGGTVSGLGAVLAITPPQLGSNSPSIGLSGGTTTPSTGTTAQPAASKTAAPAATTSQSATPAATKSVAATKSAKATTSAKASPTATATKSATASPTASATATATPTKTATTGVTGTFTGDAFPAERYGYLTARVTFTNGKLSSVTASQSPSSWSYKSLPYLINWVNTEQITFERIKQYSAAQLPCASSLRCNSGATWTAEAFWNSVKSAIAKAKA